MQYSVSTTTTQRAQRIHNGEIDIHRPLDNRINEIGRVIYDVCFDIHREYGPGLLESAYKAILAYELGERGLCLRTEVAVPLVHRDLKLEVGYRLDLLVEDLVVIEAKAVDSLHPVHEAQLLTYLKLSGKRLGYLVNFNVPLIKDGIKRFVL